jgi:Putative peptidoglycan binding domain
MRILVILVCSLALACGAYAQPEQGKPQKKKQGQSAQHGPPPTGHPTGAGTYGKKTAVAPYQVKGNKVQTPMGPYQGHMGNKGQTSVEGYGQHKGKKGQTSAGAYEGQPGKPAKGAKVTGAGKPAEAGLAGGSGNARILTKTTANAGKPFKPQHFNVAKQPNIAKAPAVRFQQGRHIEGSEHWQGQHYTAFREYHAEWHDQGWWHNHYHNNIVFVFGAPYFFNAGYWRPAWGYYPNAYYAWDGPIYAYNHLPPDQVIANVQAALQEQGYYHGEVDGSIGPLTRAAIADYQRDHGLYETAAIDEPTLESLGMT